jgi:hypothetical protein
VAPQLVKVRLNRPQYRHFAPVALLAAACLIALWPGPFSDRVLGHDTGDLADHFWGTWWFGGELLQGHWPSRTEITHLPHGGTLWHVDPVGALLAFPLRPLGPTLSWNLLICGQVFGGALAGYGLGRHVSGSTAAALTCGVICGPSAFGLGLVHSGLSEYLGLAWPALFLWALLVAFETRRRPWIPALALLACTFQAFYYGAFGILLMACLVIGPNFRGRFAMAMKIGALWAAPALAWIAAARSTLQAPDAVIRSESAPGWNYHSLPATDLFSWLHTGAWYHPDTPALGNPGILHINYLGWLALCLALWGWFRGAQLREQRAGTAAFATFALGPALSVGRVPIQLGAVAVLLPLALLYLPGSPFRWVHHPYRMAAFALPLLGIWAAVGAARLPRIVRWGAPVMILAETLLISPVPWPLATSPTQAPAILDRFEGGGAVLDLPPDGTVGNRRALLVQPDHGRAIAYGPNVFLTQDLARDPLVHEVVRALDDPRARARNRDIPPHGPVLGRPRHGASRLAEMGFEVVLLHRDLCSPAEAMRIAQILESWLGPAVETRNNVTAWRVSGVER